MFVRLQCFSLPLGIYFVLLELLLSYMYCLLTVYLFFLTLSKAFVYLYLCFF